jgi:acyl-coenzyme A thioesterase PaaI-like protein
VEFHVIDGVVHGRAIFTAPFCGPPNHVHGGVIALVFDELLGVVTVANRLGAMTGTLTIRYRRPMPILEEVRMEGRPAGVEGREVFVEGSMWHGETLLAEAEGTFVQVTGDMREKLRIPGD